MSNWLTIFTSSAAYIAFPLALHVLNNRLSAALTRRSPTNGTLIEVMKAMHVQYDGVDWVARLVRFLVDSVQDDLAFTAAGGSVTDWAELLAVKPRTYLRLSLAMDLSMSSGRFPDKKDFFLARLDGLRVGRSAKALCSPTEPGQTSRSAETRRNGQLMGTGDGSPLTFDVADLASNDAREDKTLENASFMDGLDVDVDLDRFTCLPDDLDDFFDPVLGEVADGGDSSTNKSYDADIDTGVLPAGQEAMQL